MELIEVILCFCRRYIQAQRGRLNDCSGGDGGQVELDQGVLGIVLGVVVARIGHQ
jgi:hypothetical protein